MKKIIWLSLCLGFVAAACNSSSNLTYDAVLEIKAKKYNIQLADTPQERLVGLAGVPRIKDSEGMLFLFSEPKRLEFWMKDMQFPIDIIWINGDKIVEITENIQPQPNRTDQELTIYKPSVDVDKVLEVNAGWALRKDIRPGNTITIIKP
jgi:uncharacterized membrane protein (UPF0127 family)